MGAVATALHGHPALLACTVAAPGVRTGLPAWLTVSLLAHVLAMAWLQPGTGTSAGGAGPPRMEVRLSAAATPSPALPGLAVSEPAYAPPRSDDPGSTASASGDGHVPSARDGYELQRTRAATDATTPPVAPARVRTSVSAAQPPDLAGRPGGEAQDVAARSADASPSPAADRNAHMPMARDVHEDARKHTATLAPATTMSPAVASTSAGAPTPAAGSLAATLADAPAPVAATARGPAEAAPAPIPPAATKPQPVPPIAAAVVAPPAPEVVVKAAPEMVTKPPLAAAAAQPPAPTTPASGARPATPAPADTLAPAPTGTPAETAATPAVAVSAPAPAAAGEGERGELLSLLHLAIERGKRYPAIAMRQRREGTAIVEFKLRPDGALDGLALASSSGFGLLDDEAMRAVAAVAPFQPAGHYLSGVEQFRVNVVFRLF